MPFISEHILIDLPFYKPTESPSQGQDKFSWSDRVRGDCFATANENDKCIPSTHEKLGLCVQIKTGGELMFTLPREFALDDMLAKTKQFTVEFWAEPESLEGGHKQILSRPVEVWMEGRTLSWRWSSAQFQKTCTIEAGEGLHHWAIVVVESTDQPTVHIFRDGNAQTVPEPVPEPVSSPSSSSGSANLANPAHLTPLTIGAVSSGWTGKLAHLRIWSVALTLEQIQHNRDRDITAHAAFKASTGIEWRLLNAYDEPSIYIQSSRGQLDLRLEIENATKETTLEIPQTALSKDDPNNYHFQLEFRAGTIARKLLEGGEESALLKAIRGRNEGWEVSLTDQAGQDGIAFLRTGSKISLEPGAKHTLWIPGIVAEPGSGSRSSHVMLRYQKIGINSGSGSPLTSFLDGHRLQRLNILYHEPSFDSYRKLPLEVGVVGAPVVLNNGTETCLTLYIKNLNRNEDGTAAPLVFGSANVSNDKQPKFVLEMDTYPENFRGVGGSDDIKGVSISAPRVSTPREVNVLEIHVKEKEIVNPVGWRREITFSLIPPRVHLQLNQITNGRLLDASGNNRNGTIQGTLQIVDDEKFGKCINFDGSSGNYVNLTPDVISPGKKVTFSFWARGAHDLPTENIVVRVTDNDRTNIVSVHLPWSDSIISFNCGNQGRDYDRIEKRAESNEFKGHWTHWAFTKDADKGEMTIYRDGVLWCTGSEKRREISSGTTATLGSGYRGKIAHFRSYDRVLSVEEIKLQKGQDERGNLIEIPAESIVYLPLVNLKTTAPPGQSFIRLRYEDIDKYGEGVFEIPIDRLPAIPAKITQGGAGYGLAIGHDPRVGKTDPNTESLDQILSIKQVGNGDAVRIENAGGGAGLNVVQKGSNLAAKFSGSNGVEIETGGNGSGLNVIQNGNGLAAKFSGSNGVEIENKLFVKTSNGAVDGNGVKRSNETFTELQVPDEPLYVRPLVYLRLNEVFYDNYLADGSENGRGGRIQGSLQIIDDDTFGKCLNFDGSSQNYVLLPPETIPIGKQATFSFWAWGADSLPAQTCLIHAKDDKGTRTEGGRNRVLLIHLPWNDSTIYFDCGNNGQDFDRISKQVDDSTDFKGRWTHWAFTKDADSGAMKIYKNGTEWHSGTQKSNQLSKAISVTLGRNDPSEANGAVYRGKLAHFRSYDRALSAEQIQWQKNKDENWRVLDEQRKSLQNRRQKQYELQKAQDSVNSPIHFETVSNSSGLSVTQYGDGLAALFSGGNGVEITGNLQVGQRIRDKTGEIMPVGAVLPFAGTVAPEGWLLCNGQQVTGEQYRDLAKVLFGEEKSVFNVPDYRERFFTGASDKSEYELGKEGGLARVTLTIAEMPQHQHRHSLTVKQGGGHSHKVSAFDGSGRGSNLDWTNNRDNHQGDFSTTTNGEHSHDLEGSIDFQGENVSHENRPPFVALNYIIKY